jgi:hypothetical protein
MEDDPPLTAEQMTERLGFGCPGGLRRNFPAEYQALLGKRMAYEEAQRKQLRPNLICALAEDPAPTVLAERARFGVPSSRVYYLHRDLAHAIAARHFTAPCGIHGAAARSDVRQHHFFFEPRDPGAAVACFRRFPALPSARTLPFPPGTAGTLLPVRGSAGLGSTDALPRNPPSAPVS